MSSTKDEKVLRLEGEHNEAVGGAGRRRKDRADRELLELRDDALSARPASVVEKVIAVPAGTTPGAHLREPRPDFLRARRMVIA